MYDDKSIYQNRLSSLYVHEIEICFLFVTQRISLPCYTWVSCDCICKQSICICLIHTFTAYRSLVGVYIPEFNLQLEFAPYALYRLFLKRVS